MQRELTGKPSHSQDEQEFIVIYRTFLSDALEEGQRKGVRSSLRRVLAARKLATTAADEAKIEACADLAVLERWLDQALTAESAAEALRGKGIRSPGRAKPRPRGAAPV